MMILVPVWTVITNIVLCLIVEVLLIWHMLRHHNKKSKKEES